MQMQCNSVMGFIGGTASLNNHQSIKVNATNQRTVVCLSLSLSPVSGLTVSVLKLDSVLGEGNVYGNNIG